MKYYAVARGKVPGIYHTWPEAQAQITGFSGAKFMKFDTESEANVFLNSFAKPAKTTKTKKPQSEIIAYVDGSYNPATDAVGSAILLRSGTKTITDIDFTVTSKNIELDNMRNVGGEVTASIYATKKAIALGFKSITIFYDYRGIEDWATGAWRANKSTTRNYATIMKSFEDVITINFEKVKAHTGIALNEEADRLAKQAVNIKK